MMVSAAPSAAQDWDAWHSARCCMLPGGHTTGIAQNDEAAVTESRAEEDVDMRHPVCCCTVSMRVDPFLGPGMWLQPLTGYLQFCSSHRR